MSDQLTSNKQRNSFLDFLKGMATILVIWGHLIQTMSPVGFDYFEDLAFKTIYSFHMPLFMYVSGYVFFWSCKKRSLIDNFIKRAFCMGMPMLTWGLIYYFWENWNAFPSSLLEIVVGICKRSLAIWFLWAVFLASVFVATVYYSVKSNGLRFPLMCLAGVLICVLPGNEDLSLFVYPYFVLGFLTNEKRIADQKWYSKATMVALLLWLIMLPMYEKKHYIYLSGALGGNPVYGGLEQIYIDLFRFCIGLMGTIGVASVSRYVYYKTNGTRVTKWMEQLGKHSLDVFVIQSLFLSIFVELFLMAIIPPEWHAFFAGHVFVFDFIITLPLSVACAAMLLCVSQWLEKQRIMRLVFFGKL